MVSRQNALSFAGTFRVFRVLRRESSSSLIVIARLTARDTPKPFELAPLRNAFKRSLARPWQWLLAQHKVSGRHAARQGPTRGGNDSDRLRPLDLCARGRLSDKTGT
jgi:hypothetical protein